MTESTNPQAAGRCSATAILEGRTSLGIELGSTRIKACLVGEDPTEVLAVGSHEWENRFVDRVWTYSLEDVWSGLQAAYADLVADVRRRYDVQPETFGAIGVSAMMHGYLAFDANDELLVPFRTWRNTSTGAAAAELSEQFGLNIPLRWSIAHLHQAILDEEPHVPQVRLRHHARRVRALAAHGPQGDRRGRRLGHVPDRLRDGRLRRAAARGRSTGSSRTARRRCARRTAARGARRRTAGRRADGRGRRAARPDRLRCGPAPRCARPRATPAPAWSRPARSPPAPATSAPARASSRWSCWSGRSSTPTTSSTSSRRRRAIPWRWCTATTARASSPPGSGVFARFAAVTGASVDTDAVFEALFREALEGEADAGGLLAYNHLAGEPIAGLAEGRPLIVRTPDSRLTLANFMRAQLYGVYGTLSARHAGARRRGRRTRPDVRPRRHLPHRRRRPAVPGRRARRTGRGRRDGVGRRCVGHRGARVLPLRRPTRSTSAPTSTSASSRMPRSTPSTPTPRTSPDSRPSSTATAPASPPRPPPSTRC